MENNIRVFHINCNYMGTKLHKTMLQHLEKYNKTDVVFCPIYSGSNLVTEPGENAIISKCFSRFDRFFFFFKQKKILSSVEKSVNITQFDCIHAYTLFTDGNVAYELFRKYGIPYVVAIRNTDLIFLKYRCNLRKRGREILKNASAIFFLSKTTEKQVASKYLDADFYKLIKPKITIIPNGIDDYWILNRYKKNPQTDRILRKEINICCVAEIIKRKNIPMLVEAVEELSNKGWEIKVDVIGKKTDDKEYKKIVSSRNVRYHEPMSKEELIKYYRNADLFVLPSKGETFGLVYAEAISQSLPVIYGAGEGFDGQIDEGVVGYHVNTNSVYDICRKIEKIVEQYEVLSNACMDNLEQFKWDNIIDIYCSIYRSILSRRERE